jgi:hypothetical protein
VTRLRGGGQGEGGLSCSCWHGWGEEKKRGVKGEGGSVVYGHTEYRNIGGSYSKYWDGGLIGDIHTTDPVPEDHKESKDYGNPDSVRDLLCWKL